LIAHVPICVCLYCSVMMSIAHVPICVCLYCSVMMSIAHVPICVCLYCSVMMSNSCITVFYVVPELKKSLYHSTKEMSYTMIFHNTNISLIMMFHVLFQQWNWNDWQFTSVVQYNVHCYLPAYVCHHTAEEKLKLWTITSLDF
jgi:hypothetical protein